VGGGSPTLHTSQTLLLQVLLQTVARWLQTTFLPSWPSAGQLLLLRRLLISFMPYQAVFDFFLWINPRASCSLAGNKPTTLSCDSLGAPRLAAVNPTLQPCTSCALMTFPSCPRTLTTCRPC